MTAALTGRRVLLFGAHGQLGQELAQTLAPVCELTALDRTRADFARPDSLRRVVRRHAPEVIINAAAYTAVDAAENEPDVANIVNAEAPGVLAEEADQQGACVVHYSSDYVFDGRNTTSYSEEDTPNPLSAYGRSKLEGELAVADACRRHLIFRTSWLFGPHGRNFLKTILRLATDRETLRVVADQYGAPTSVETVAEVTGEALCLQLNASPDNSNWGLYHLAANGETTWHGYARHIVAQARSIGMPLKATAENIIPITSSEYAAPAPRPANSRLATDKLRSRFRVRLPDWQTDVERVLRQVSVRQNQ